MWRGRRSSGQATRSELKTPNQVPPHVLWVGFNTSKDRIRKQLENCYVPTLVFSGNLIYREKKLGLILPKISFLIYYSRTLGLKKRFKIGQRGAETFHDLKGCLVINLIRAISWTAVKEASSLCLPLNSSLNSIDQLDSRVITFVRDPKFITSLWWTCGITRIHMKSFFAKP